MRITNKKGVYVWQVVIGAVIAGLLLIILSTMLFTTSDGAQEAVSRASMTDDFSNSGVVDALDQCPCDINNILVTRQGSGQGWCIAQGLDQEDAGELQSSLPEGIKESIDYDETVDSVVYRREACLWAIQNEEWPSQR